MNTFQHRFQKKEIKKISNSFGSKKPKPYGKKHKIWGVVNKPIKGNVYNPMFNKLIVTHFLDSNYWVYNANIFASIFGV
jgi:hypothetical protein